MKSLINLLIVFLTLQYNVHANDAPDVLIKKIKAKLEKVNDYTGQARLKTNVAFIKAPAGLVKVYYKRPNKLKIEKEKGLSILPKGGVILSPATLLTINNYDAIDAGEVIIQKVKTRKIRLLPRDGESDIVLMDLYIDEEHLLLLKTTVTTKENGTFDMEMNYAKYAEYMLPDHLVFTFSVKNYKMPKSLSLDFDEELVKEEAAKYKNKKGEVELTYTNYIINKGISDHVFQR